MSGRRSERSPLPAPRRGEEEVTPAALLDKLRRRGVRSFALTQEGAPEGAAVVGGVRYAGDHLDALEVLVQRGALRLFRPVTRGRLGALCFEVMQA